MKAGTEKVNESVTTMKNCSDEKTSCPGPRFSQLTDPG